MADQTSSSNTFENAVENVQAQELRFRREWFYFMASVLAWGLFWEIAERRQENPHAQVLAWMAVFVAVWIAENF